MEYAYGSFRDISNGIDGFLCQIDLGFGLSAIVRKHRWPSSKKIFMKKKSVLDREMVAPINEFSSYQDDSRDIEFFHMMVPQKIDVLMGVIFTRKWLNTDEYLDEDDTLFLLCKTTLDITILLTFLQSFLNNKIETRYSYKTSIASLKFTTKNDIPIVEFTLFANDKTLTIFKPEAQVILEGLRSIRNQTMSPEKFA